MDITTNTSLAVQAFEAVCNPLPPKVAAIAVAWEQIAYVEPPDPQFDVDNITADNAADLVHQLAVEISVKDSYSAAKRQAKHQLGLRVLRACAEAAPGVLAKLQKSVDTTSAVFVDAYLKLPQDKSAGSLLMHPNGSELYSTVLEAQGVLENAQSFAVGLTNLPAYGGFSPQPQLAIIGCSTRSEFERVMKAPSDDSGINPEFAVAAELGIPFRLLDPIDANALAAKLNDEEAVSTFPGFASLQRNPDGSSSILKADGSPVGA